MQGFDHPRAQRVVRIQDRTWVNYLIKSSSQFHMEYGSIVLGE